MHNAAVLFLPFVSRLSLRDQNHAIRLCAASLLIAPRNPDHRAEMQVALPAWKVTAMLVCGYQGARGHTALRSIAAKSLRYSLSPYSDDKMDEVALRYPKIFYRK